VRTITVNAGTPGKPAIRSVSASSGTIVVAFTPGGPSDVLARIIGQRLNEILHQPFIVENRPGSGGKG